MGVLQAVNLLSHAHVFTPLQLLRMLTGVRLHLNENAKRVFFADWEIKAHKSRNEVSARMLVQPVTMHWLFHDEGRCPPSTQAKIFGQTSSARRVQIVVAVTSHSLVDCVKTERENGKERKERKRWGRNLFVHFFHWHLFLKHLCFTLNVQVHIQQFHRQGFVLTKTHCKAEPFMRYSWRYLQSQKLCTWWRNPDPVQSTQNAQKERLLVSACCCRTL